MTLKKIGTKEMYRARAFSVNKDELVTPEGKAVFYDVVIHIGSVSIVPVDDQGNIYFIKQFRPSVDEWLLELPAGTLEPGESFEEACHREVREEVGMQAGRISRLGAYYLAPGYCTELMESFLATDLTENPLPPDDAEYLIVEKIPVKEAYQRAQNGEIRDGKSLAALLLAKHYLQKYL